MNLAHYFTPFYFFLNRAAASFTNTSSPRTSLSPHIRTPEGVAFEKKLAQVPIKSRNKFITADLMDYQGALLKLHHSVRDFNATDSAAAPPVEAVAVAAALARSWCTVA
jgi:hypothetical protein